MSSVESSAATTEPSNVNSPLSISTYLSPQRIAVDVHVTSKKRALEETASMLVRDNPSLDKDTVFQTLIDRERLGSTGIGNGVAIPHGRINGIEEPIAAVVKLRQGLDFDAIDKQPIELLVGLLVPPEAHDVHLKLLANIAKLFSQEALRKHFCEAANADDLYDRLTS